MLKPSEIRNYEFKPAGRNTYRAEEVDAFFAEVLISYERVFRENSELVKRASLLADKLEQYKHDEVDIKQAVLSAQKAADIIIRDAEESVEDSKREAEAILAAAKGEAMVIRTDAEKQAIADSDLLMSIAKDKAEDIIKKAKEKAHTILIAANNSANDKMGAANRTITSESLHYDMLKKEVSEFRASILAQYKTHIELISKLPELAVEEASKIKMEPTEEPTIDDVKEEIDESFYTSEDSVLEFVEEADAIEEEPQASEEVALDDYVDDVEIIEASDEADSSVVDEVYEEEEVSVGEEVVKTTLPYDFFAEDTTLEFVEDDSEEELTIEIGDDNNIPPELEKYLVSEDNDQILDIEPVEDVFSDSNEEEAISDDTQDDTQDDYFVSEPDEDDGESFADFVDSIEAAIDDKQEEEPHKSIIDDYGSYNSFFDSIEVIDSSVDLDSDDDKPKRGFFFRKK